jgi:hypothetical protein
MHVCGHERLSAHLWRPTAWLFVMSSLASRATGLDGLTPLTKPREHPVDINGVPMQKAIPPLMDPIP